LNRNIVSRLSKRWSNATNAEQQAEPRKKRRGPGRRQPSKSDCLTTVELTGMDESKQAHSIADRVSYATTCRRYRVDLRSGPISALGQKPATCSALTGVKRT
jgi:hypothetical protein